MAKYPETEFSRKLTTNPNNCLCHTNQSPKPVLPDEDCRLFMTIGIFGNPFLALIDTGAARSYIGNKVVELLKHKKMLPAAGQAITVQLADGTEVNTKGRCRVPSQIGGNHMELEYQHLPGLTSDIIIGMDFLIQKDVQLNFRQKTMKLFDEVIDLNVNHASRLDGIKGLEGNQLIILNKFLETELEHFKNSPGRTAAITHTITVKPEAEPCKQRYYPRNPAIQAIINEEVDKMLEDKVIEPSRSPWSSPIVLVKKPSGKYRFCIDYRQVNQRTVKDAYPLPQVQGILHRLREARYISTLDLKNGYWQVPLSEESKPVTAFTVPGRGLFQFQVLPFGLHSAPATFQRLLDEILGPEMEEKAFAYLDDIIIISKSFNEHLNILQEVLRRLRENGLQLQIEKCVFCRTELKYLGHVVNREGVRPDPEKVEAIVGMEAPGNVKGVRRFLGVASWYRKFIPQFSKLAEPLTELHNGKTHVPISSMDITIAALRL
uniref:Reverse transcriptase domain-containing protein n=3 Tax=Photinus pyralis TaxID=7054 RepID=A0A1Y1K1B2_PHOPY